MFLKEIEMQGFKSFADKTKVSFEKGVTAVVGPNGSGKSNITESLRWALGESSAKSLRGGKMPDVIFAGTENRKPLNYAQVTVMMDNSDGFIKEQSDEIRVERHIYRNGDSDYLINGKKVRLRDIHDLFMDTGLGRDSFSIISQGRVEDIFKSKPEERRMIFEEAAGVLKYKTRKKETQTKLSQTQDNLDRLEDIIYELDSQVGPLKKQAAVAREFMALDQEKQALQLDVLIHDIRERKEELTQSETELGLVKSHLTNYFEFKEKSERKNQLLKEKRHRLSDKMDQKQADLIELNRLVSHYQHQIEVNQLESNQKAEKTATLIKTIAELEVGLSNLDLQITTEKTKQASLTQEHNDLKIKLKGLKEQQLKAQDNPETLVEKKREEFVALLQKESQLSNKLTLLTSDIESQEQQSEEFSKELISLKENLGQLERTKEEAKGYSEEKTTLVEALRTRYATKRSELLELESRYQKKQSLYFDQLDKIKSKEARKNSLSSILKNHSQFYSGVKAVLQVATKIGGIVGAVSEQMTFDRHLQVAIEIALGASSQHVIVKNEQTAREAIAFLKESKQGRATFLPLTTIKPRAIQERYRQQLKTSSGFLGIASELTTYPSELSQIFENLLGSIVIFDSIENANQAAKKVQYAVRFVTLDGSEIRPGGSFSGGSVRQNNSTFIKPELDELEKEVSALKEENRNLEEEVSTLYQILENLRKDLETLKTEGETARLEEQKAQLSYQQYLEKWEDLRQQISLLEGRSHQDNPDSLLGQKEELENELSEILNLKTSLETEMKALKENKDSLLLKMNQLTEEIANLQLEERDVFNQLKFTDERLNAYQSQRDKLVVDLGQKETEKISLENLDETAKQEDLSQKLAEADMRKSDDEAELIRLRFEFEDHEAQLEDLAEELQKESQKNETYIREQAQIEAKLQGLKEKLRQSAVELTENYQLSFEEASQEAKVIENISHARQTLRDIGQRIKRLGPINTDAIEQFEEVNQRLEFLSQQKMDLDKAKDLLVSTIDDMDSEVKHRFKSTFEAIRESFKVTFSQMFGGGNADLVLTDGNLLTSGVDIAVQPPGKKLQSLNLMSGGEKSLTALALLFAIIRVKTVPFVIFDEVEAALDEANVKRFGDYLNRFDQSSQFIVVTHRRGTMAAADSIYGVTMQESGVSKILSVKLKEAEKLIP